jgi:hypothetical protein
MFVIRAACTCFVSTKNHNTSSYANLLRQGYGGQEASAGGRS